MWLGLGGEGRLDGGRETGALGRNLTLASSTVSAWGRFSMNVLMMSGCMLFPGQKSFVCGRMFSLRSGGRVEAYGLSVLFGAVRSRTSANNYQTATTASITTLQSPHIKWMVR